MILTQKPVVPRHLLRGISFQINLMIDNHNICIGKLTVKRLTMLNHSRHRDWLVYECGTDQVYIGLNRQMGSCQCMKEFHLIYTAENKCYEPFTRGPCEKKMWLVPSSRREANCRPSPCPEKQIDGKHFYWKGHFHGPAGCYKPGTRGPCPERSTFIVTDYVLGHSRCERDWNFSI
jgi:hypothetical protein